MCKTIIKVVLLEDNQEHFDKIKEILINCKCEIVWDFKTTKMFMADYDSYRNCSPAFTDIIEENLNEKVLTLLNDDKLIWIIDINWTGTPAETDADEYGIDFCKKYKPKLPIILSVNPKSKYRNTIRGLKYVSKFEENGDLFSKQFELKLLEEMGVNLPKTESPYDYKRSK